MLHTVRISDIGLYLRCPRLVYLDSVRPLGVSQGTLSLLVREAALSISHAENIQERLLSSLLKASEEIPLVYGTDPQEVAPALEAARGMVPAMAAGYGPWLERLLPCDIDVELRSDRLRLSGRLDRLAPGRVPSIVRQGSPPEDGVWKRERLALAGYALLIEDSCGTRVQRGIVEYPRQGVVREAAVRSIDRSRVLRIRDKIQEIKDGEMPERPDDARCDICLERERCGVRTYLASSLF